jgi:tetratricopeptide (TPR) repeat protein
LGLFRSPNRPARVGICSMKTERRHELETNQLADSLGHWVEAARPYTNAIVAAVLIVVVAIAVLIVARSRSAAGNAQAWDDYFAALSRLDRLRLEDLGEAYSGTPVGAWSLCMAADLGLDEGANQLFKDKLLARDILRKAADQYQQVLGNTHEDALLKQAWFGLARTHECLGELKQAEEEYGRIVAKWPGTPLAQAAEARSKDLQRHETKEFYDWFAKQDIRKRVQPGPGTPGFRAPFDFGSLPDASGGGAAGTGDEGAGAPTSETPGTESAPADTAPDDAAPADAAPAGAAASDTTPPAGDAGSGDKKPTGAK